MQTLEKEFRKTYITVNETYDLLRVEGCMRSFMWIFSAIEKGVLRSAKIYSSRVILKKDVANYIRKQKQGKKNERKKQ